MIPILILTVLLSIFGGPTVTDAGGGSPTISATGAGPASPAFAATADDGGGGSPTHP